jgi:hypothetical protein
MAREHYFEKTGTFFLPFSKKFGWEFLPLTIFSQVWAGG